MRDAAKKDGRTVLYVSHNMNTIRQLCDRCVVLDKGKVVFEGDVEEAIGVYMRSSGNVDQTYYDYTNSKARSSWTSGNVRLKSLRILNKEAAFFQTNEPLEFELEVRTKAEIPMLHLRLELLFGDDMPVGTAPDITLTEMHTDETKKFTVMFNPQNLTRGKYKMNIVLFQIDEYGNSFDEDLILPAFSFCLEDDEKIIWNQSSWGHIRFSDVSVY